MHTTTAGREIDKEPPGPTLFERAGRGRSIVMVRPIAVLEIPRILKKRVEEAIVRVPSS